MIKSINFAISEIIDAFQCCELEIPDMVIQE